MTDWIQRTRQLLDHPTINAKSSWIGYANRLEIVAHDLAEQVEKHEEWKDRAQTTLHEAANEHDLCPIFDDVMEQIGLERRIREYDVEVEVSLTVILTAVTATSEKAAHEVVDRDNDLVGQHLATLTASDINRLVDEVTVSDVNGRS